MKKLLTAFEALVFFIPVVWAQLESVPPLPTDPVGLYTFGQLQYEVKTAINNGAAICA